MNQQEKIKESSEGDFYKGLSNAEILMVFYKFKKYYDNMNKNLSENRISKSIDTPMGPGIVLKEVPEEHVQKFKETDFYTTLESVVEKLEPVVNLIEDCSPEMKKFSKHFKNLD